jgi:hypothetical protein
MSTLEVNKITPAGAATSITLGDSGDTFTIPSGVTLDGSSATLTGFGTATVNGITMADQWRLSADFSLPTGRSDITSNIERADTRGAGQIGSAMSVSSGVFTFPSTGYYLLLVNLSFYTPANNGNLTFETKFTSNNSTYDITAQTIESTNANQSVSFGSGSTSILLDITDTSNQKIKFAAGGGPSGTAGVLRGDTDQNETTFTFIRLGDT